MTCIWNFLRRPWAADQRTNTAPFLLLPLSMFRSFAFYFLCRVSNNIRSNILRVSLKQKSRNISNELLFFWLFQVRRNRTGACSFLFLLQSTAIWRTHSLPLICKPSFPTIQKINSNRILSSWLTYKRTVYIHFILSRVLSYVT